jgi:hypothetical protein
LAKETLCIPATSAPSERLFSSAGLTIANDRAGLTPDNASDLVFLKTTLKFVDTEIKKEKLKKHKSG